MELNKEALTRRYIRNDPGRWKVEGFARVPTRILHDFRLGKAELLVFLVLSTRTFKGKDASFPSIATLMKESRYSKNCVIRAIRNLERNEYIRVERSKKNSRKKNRYILLEAARPATAPTRVQ